MIAPAFGFGPGGAAEHEEIGASRSDLGWGPGAGMCLGRSWPGADEHGCELAAPHGQM